MRLARGAIAFAVVLVCLLGAASAGADSLPSGFQDEVVLEPNKPTEEQPTNFKFAPDGRIFVALKGGKILVYPKGAGPTTAPTVFANLAKQTYDKDDHGLLGLALDPKFEEGRPYVYALYTFNHELGVPPNVEMPKYGSAGNFEGDECPQENHCVVSGRLVRLTAEGNVAKKVGGEDEQTVLLEGWCQQSSTHSIGDLGFGPEGALYVSGGDGGLFTNTDYGQEGNLCGDPNGTKGTNMVLNPEAEGGSLRSQSVLRPDGKVLLNGTVDRIQPDPAPGGGEAEGWPGNPLAASANANARRIIAFGFRNPFRFTISPRLGDVFVGNVGNEEDEEIDRVPIGGALYNSGWPCYEGLVPDPQFKALNLNACNRLYEAPGSTATPFFYYSHQSPVAPGDGSRCKSNHGSAISGSAFYEGSAYPSEYDDAFFFGDSVRGCIWVMLADADGEPDPSTIRPFLTEGQNYPGVAIEEGPEGLLWYINLFEGTIDRITYNPGAPTAKLKTVGNPWGPVPSTFEFDASESTAVEGHHLSYEWDLEGGNGAFNAGHGNAKEQFTFNDYENHTVAVRVEDETTGDSSIAQVTVYPGDSPPKVTISQPLPTFTWGVGQQIHFAGSAKAESGTGEVLEPSRLYWRTRLLHCPFEATNCHEHPMQVFDAVTEGNVGAPDHDYPSYVNFLLTATDWRGLSSEAQVKVKARPVALQLRSEPPGISVIAGTKTLSTPAELLVIENSPTTVIAPATAVVEGVTCTFERWSDGGARVHEIPTHAGGTYTAIYAGPSGPGACPKAGDGGGGGGGGGSGAGGGSGSSSSIGPPTPGAVAAPKLGGHPPKQTSSTTARFTFSGPAGAKFLCRLDRGELAGCRSPRVYKKLKRGRHTVRIYAQVGAGRSAATAFSWKIVAAK